MKILTVIMSVLVSISLIAEDEEFKPFDLLKDQKQISSVDLVIFQGDTDYDYLGGKVEINTFVVGHTRSKIKKIVHKIDWNPKKFNQLFSKYKPKKKYGDCFCHPKYAMGLVFKKKDLDEFADTDDEFGDDNEFDKSAKYIETKVAIALFDESHDSILISDLKNGLKEYRFSKGHSPKSLIPIYIKSTLNGINESYKFMDYDHN